MEEVNGQSSVGADLENGSWKEQNARNFENCETGLLNLKKLVLQILSTWRVTLTTMSDCTFSDFLFVFFFLYGLGVSCIHPVYFGLRPTVLF